MTGHHTFSCDQCGRTATEKQFQRDWITVSSPSGGADICDMNCLVAWAQKNGAQPPQHRRP